MTTSTIILILLSVIISGVVAFYQYLFKADNQNKTNWLLAFLRFISVFSLLLLLINPVVSRKVIETNKIPLAIVADNSRSISELKANAVALKLFEKLNSNSALKEKFEIQSYTFDDTFIAGKSLDFKGNQSNIDDVANNLKQLNKNTFYPVVLLTDGNQTIGNDYAYSFQESTTVFPVVLGDTTATFDLKINQLNANKYAFLKNKFPVEVFLQYNGNKSVSTTFSIEKNGKRVISQAVNFDKKNKAQSVQILLEAERVGLQKYKAVLSSSVKEKNTYNNSKNFAVEVLDQKKEIAIISDISHPDLGAFKRAIESNAQRKVTIIKTNSISDLQKYNVLILYQPTASFRKIYEVNKNLKINTFIVTGMATDFNFLNQMQSDLQFKLTNKKEDFSPSFLTDFNLFAQNDIQFSQLPPLENPFGKITEKGSLNTLLTAKVNGIEVGNPILTFSEKGNSRNAYLLGENSWKWRMESFVLNQSYEKYDLFIDKVIQYLTTNSAKKSLLVEHESFYNSGETIEIFAQYFNKSYELEENATLSIYLTNKATKTTKNYNFSKANNGYQAIFDGLTPGNYSFQVKETTSNASYNGTFEVLDFDVEKQFVNPDVSKLQQLANQNNGKIIFPNQIEKLIQKLLQENTYLPVEKTIIKNSPLIDFLFLLIIIVVSLSTEWFIRKYNGLL
jgi:energy-coupling factor transporter transmembrane protein EcfT